MRNAGVSGDRVDQGRKGSASIEARKCLPDFEKRVLGHFFCPRRIANDRENQPENFGLITLEQDFESPIFLTLREQLPYVLVHTVS